MPDQANLAMMLKRFLIESHDTLTACPDEQEYWFYELADFFAEVIIRPELRRLWLNAA